MKRFLFMVLVIGLSACDRTSPDFKTVSAALKTINDDSVMFFGASRGGTIVGVPESPELLKIYNETEKDAVFIPLWDETRDIAQQGTCLINIFSPDEYRLFCGGPDDIKTGQWWAVRILRNPDKN